jgi:hypothetical protein
MPIETLDWRMVRSLSLNNCKRLSDPPARSIAVEHHRLA